MLIVTTDGLAGYEIRSVLGEALGTAVQTDQAASRAQAPHAQAGSSATFRVTGEQPALGLAAARREAVERLGEEARRKGANAVVGMCFDTVSLGNGGHEVCAYGTAVWVEPVKHAAQPGAMPQQGAQVPPYAEPYNTGGPQHGGAPMVARNLTMGIQDRPR